MGMTSPDRKDPDMTTTTPDMTPEEAVREHAWQQALYTYSQWEQYSSSASGGAGGAGYRDPSAATEARRLRTLLDAMVEEHGFQDTRVDPLGLSYFERRSASWECPPLDREPCTRDSDTCTRHWARRRAGLPKVDCGWSRENQ